MVRKFILKQLKLQNKGVAKVLGELEAEVMEIVWQRGELTVREVCDLLSRKRRAAFNTVMTIMNRLVEKDILRKKQKDNIYKYSPCQNKREFLESVSSEVIASLIKDPQLFSLASFVDVVEDADPETLKELEKLIQSKKDGRGR